MDNAQAEYYRKMAEIRKQTFTPDTGGYLATYYKETADTNLKAYQDLEPDYQDSYNKLMAINDIVTAAQQRGDEWYSYEGKMFKVRNFLNKDGTMRDLNDILKTQRWYSTSQGKMMPGRVGRVIEEYQKNKSDYDLAAEEHKKYQKLYDDYNAQLAIDNERRRQEFLKQQQETLAGGQASAYRGATYTEKPK